jgi:hypothetical protein
MRLAARIIGFSSVGLGAEFIGEGAYVLVRAARGWPVFANDAGVMGGVLIGAVNGVALAACILSFWRERAAGIMLVSVAAAMGIFVSIFPAPAIIPDRLMIWLWMGLPLLVAGVLFLDSWRLSRELA